MLMAGMSHLWQRRTLPLPSFSCFGMRFSFGKLRLPCLHEKGTRSECLAQIPSMLRRHRVTVSRQKMGASLGCLRECVESFLARVVATLDHLGPAISDADDDEFFIEFQNVEFFFSHRCFHLKVEMPTLS